MAKSGSWFLELILNILLLGGVAFVTFAARGEQERGLAVPLFAAVSPATTRTAVEAPTPPAVAVPNVPDVQVPKVTVPAVNPGAVTQTYEQAWGTLQVWAAGLDGKISADELKKIQDSVGGTWSGSQGVRDYLKQMNDKINAGQADQVVQEALRTLGQQANDKKMQVLNSVVAFMKSNGVSWDQIQQTLSGWVTQSLKMSPLDVWNSLKF